MNNQASPTSVPDAPVSDRTVRVWDPLTRLFHWCLAGSIFLAWVTDHGFDTVHHWAGYVAITLVTIRVIWGLIGPRYARFTHFVRHPRDVLAYLSAIKAGNETRHIGHNPAGGAMVVALLLGVIGTAITGWMETTDTYFGVAWVEHLHSALAHGLLILVAVHLGGVALASYRHRENLVGAMLTGRKRQAEPDAVD